VIVQLIGEDDENAPVEFHITKNRHAPKKGHITNLVRDAKRGGMWFNESDREEWQDDSGEL
jgi:hypothetical protein